MTEKYETYSKEELVNFLHKRDRKIHELRHIVESERELAASIENVRHDILIDAKLTLLMDSNKRIKKTNISLKELRKEEE